MLCSKIGHSRHIQTDNIFFYIRPYDLIMLVRLGPV